MTLQTLIRPFAFAAIAALVVACGGSTASGTPGSAATQAPASQAAESSIPLPSLGPDFSFTLPSADKELEDLLPDDVGGATITKASMQGSDLVGEPDSDLSQVLGQLGKGADDISAAFGNGGGVSLAAYRLKGVDANTLLTAFVQLLSADEAPTVTDANVGGKAVKKVVTADMTSYVYTKGDVLFTVGTSGDGTEAAVAEAISKLP